MAASQKQEGSEIAASQKQKGSQKKHERFRQDFIQDNVKDFKEHYRNHGLKNFKTEVEKSIDDWKDIPVHIAITGSSGSGKSTFINTIRGLKADSPGAAETGVVETTKSLEAYDQPDNPNLKWWDLPGVGTPNYPRETYLKKMEYEKYDFFLILSESRFTQDDLFLGQELEKEGKKFIFARTKVDNDMKNEKEDHPKEFSEDKVKAKIHDNVVDESDKHHQFQPEKIFLINCKNLIEPDLEFELLYIYMMDNLPNIKRDAMVLSLRRLTKSSVDQIKLTLKASIWKRSIPNAFLGATPLEVFGDRDIPSIFKATTDFMKEFGLDDESLENLANTSGASVADLQKNFTRMDKAKTEKGLQEIVTNIKYSSEGTGFATMLKTTLSIVLPFISSVLTAPMGYAMTYYVLQIILEEIAKDAYDVQEAAIKAMSASYANEIELLRVKFEKKKINHKSSKMKK